MEQILAFLLKSLEGTVPKPVAVAGVLAIVAILLSQFAEPQMKPPLSAVVAMMISLIAAGFSVHFYLERTRTEVAKGAERTMSDKPSQGTSGKNSPIFNDKAENLHIGDVYNEPAPPTLKVIEEKGQARPDGTYDATLVVEVVAKTRPAMMRIAVSGRGLLEGDVFPAPMLQNSGIGAYANGSSVFQADVPSPMGRYEIRIHMAAKTPLNLKYGF